MKFGGTSLEDTVAFERVAGILLSYEKNGGPPPVAVVSAMSRVTDALMKSLRLAEEGQCALAAQILDEHFARHQEVAGNLGTRAGSEMRACLDQARQEILKLLKGAESTRHSSAAARDQVAAFGEILSARLLTLVLTEHGAPGAYVDARRCVKTDREHGNAQPIVETTSLHTRATLEPMLQKRKLPVLGGFIGSTSDGQTTTMGRGSSDYTATLVSAALGARETQIWTDVSGVHTADPSLVQEARTIPQLSYDEAEEMARRGAKVLHQRMFEPVRTQNIPVRICNSYLPEERGTLVGNQQATEKSGQTIKAIAHKAQIVRIDLKSTPARVANGFQSSIETILNRYHVPLELVARSTDGLSIACDEKAPLDSILSELERCGSVSVTDRRAAVTCIGEGLAGSSTGISRMTEILKDFGSPLVWEKTSRINLVSIVATEVVGALVRRLHRELFEQQPKLS